MRTPPLPLYIDSTMRSCFVYLEETFDYNLDTGFITQKSNGLRRDTKLDQQGYARIRFRLNGKAINLRAHQVAWFLTFGVWPNNIDHRNRIKDDNKIGNLRDCFGSENQRNQSVLVDNKSGHPGVAWDKKTKSWRVFVYVDKRPKWVGRFLSLDEATAARVLAEHKYGVAP